MSYIGNEPTSVAFLTDTFSGNGSTTAFTMSAAPATTTSILVAVTGVLQDPSTYSVVGTTLTFSAAPPTGTGNISVRYLGIPASGVTTTAYRTITEFTATAGQTTFTPPSYTPGFINVYRNGALLSTTDYTATNGTTVVLGSAASASDLVTIESFYVSSVLNALPNTGGTLSGSLVVNGATGQNPLIVQNNGTEAMRVNSSGNVGIGTNSPTAGYRLSLTGGVGLNIQNTGASDNSVVKCSNSSKNWYFGLRGDTSNVWAVSDDSAFRMVIDGSGNVGIGTATPTYGTLEVAQGSAGVVSVINNTVGAWAFRKVRSDGSNGMGIYDATGFGVPAFYAAGAERARISSFGSREFSDSFGLICYGEGGTGWGNVSSHAFNLTTLFPDISFTSVGISLNIQVITQSSGTTSTSAMLNLIRTSSGTWVSTTVNSTTSGGTTVTGSGSGTTITLTFGAAGQYGKAIVRVVTQS